MKYFAVHMKNSITGQRLIKRVEAASVDEAADKVKFNCSSPWRWEGSEPWKNVADNAIHLGGGYYTMTGWDE